MQSSPAESVAAVVDHTKKRLSNRSPVVKQKTLRLIKFICSKGSSEFKRRMSKQASSVRCVSWSMRHCGDCEQKDLCHG